MNIRYTTLNNTSLPSEHGMIEESGPPYYIDEEGCIVLCNGYSIRWSWWRVTLEISHPYYHVPHWGLPI